MDVLNEGPETIDLARRPDFRLGQLLFVPSACRVVAAGQERPIQRRVMEVIVTLADMANRTVARDELIRRCWGQRVVGDDAVNRVIAKVRELARGLEPVLFYMRPRIRRLRGIEATRYPIPLRRHDLRAQSEPQRPHHLHDRRELRIAVFAQRSIQAFTGYAGVARDLGHAA